MRIAIISDIHGNLAALDAVLADLRTRSVEAVYCLGDLVGYAAHPNEVTERIRAAGIPTIMGNYDDGVGFERDECGCAYTNPVDRTLGDRSLAWTKATVGATYDDGYLGLGGSLNFSPGSWGFGFNLNLKGPDGKQAY